MKIICDNCHTKYSIADTKLTPGKVFKIKCKKCGNVIVVKPAVAEPAQDDDDATRVVDYAAMSKDSKNDAPKIWHVVLDKEQEGPFSIDEIKEKIDLGFVKPDTFGWREGLENWQEIEKIDEFKGLFPDKPAAAQAVAAPAAAPSAAEPAADEPDDPFSSAASSDADDPFASFDGGAKESSPFGNQEKKDALFPDDDEDEEDENAPAFKGQRHENSVLFSLDNLQALASGGGGGGGGARKPMGSPRPGYITPTSGGSGLADIQSMASSLGGSEQNSSPDLSMMDLPAAPVMATPLTTSPTFSHGAAMGHTSMESEKPKWLLPAIIAGVAVIVIAAMFFMMKGGKKDGDSSTNKDTVAANNDNKTNMGSMDSKVAANTMKPDDMKTKDGMNTDSMATDPVMNADTMKVDDMKVDTMKVDTMKVDTMKVSNMKVSNMKVSNSSYMRPSNYMRVMKEMKVAPVKETMTSGCTKVWCMLKNNSPKCCCKYKSGGCGGSSMSSGGDPCAAHSKDKLSSGDIRAGIGGIRGSVRSCFSKYGIHGKVKIRVSVGCNGRVKYASAKGSHAGTPIGKCIQRAVRRAKFPKFKRKKVSFTYPFVG
jgi:predicted Zn finger-like uncharacterized protein